LVIGISKRRQEPFELEQGAGSANGLLAILTVSTVGVAPGTVEALSLTPAPQFGGPTAFAGVPIQITNGSLRIVPEPSTACFSILAAMLLYWRLSRQVRR
jgi:hypothetical protein